MGESSRRTLRRVALAAVWLGAVYYLLLGGEYSWPDLHALQAEETAAGVRLDSLRSAADSVTRRADSLATDAFAIERLARERYGFIRDGEHLYRFVSTGTGDEVDRPRDRD